MKISLFIILIIIPFIIFSQQRNNSSKISLDSSIRQWSNAIVNIEVKDNTSTSKERDRGMDSIKNLVNQGLLPVESFYDYFYYLLATLPNFSGTAIFFQYKSKYYLITARHLLYDKNASLVKKIANGLPYEDSLNNAYTEIYFIPRPDQINDSIAESSCPLFPPYANGNYVFSNPETDVAIIGLNTVFHQFFVNLLIYKGYKPITISDIDTTGNLQYGDDIFCIGYPFVGIEKERKQSVIDRVYKSNYIFNYASTFGKIAIPKLRGTSFLADLSVLPGNSGGPLIKNNKLIGIVTSQPRYNIEDSKGNALPYYSRFTYAIGIKANQIMPLLRELILKEQSKK